MWKRCCVIAFAACIGLFVRGALVINEVCYDNSALADETGDTDSDWIELYNSGPDSVNILDYALGDSSPYDESSGVRLPSYNLPAGGFLVVFASSTLAEYTVWTNAPDIAAIPANATWRYSAPSGAPAASWATNAFNDAAWASGMAPLGYNDSKQNMDCATVLDYGGNPADRYPAAYFRKSFKVINPSVVTGLVVRARINDGMVLYLNGVEVKRVFMPPGMIGYTTLASAQMPSTLWTNFTVSAAGLVQGTNVLAVEVHQGTVSSVDLIMDLRVTALVNEQVPIIHGQFGLSKAGENVHLFNTLLTRIHKFDAPGFEIGENKSYGLAVDGVTGTYKVYNRPTPGRPNDTYDQKYTVSLTSEKPTFSVPPGVYPASQSVVLNTATPGYQVFYTLDGSDPLASSSFVYSGNAVAVNSQAPATSGLAWTRTNPPEITNGVPTADWQAPVGSVAKAVVLRAVTISLSGTECSPETRGTYFIGPQFTNRVLPIVSLITDTNNLFGFTDGIYVPGKFYADSPEGYGQNKWGKPHANYHQDSLEREWERPVQVELFETNQTTAAFSHLLGMTMHGGGTRAIPQKTLYLLARAEYGSEILNYALFPDEAPTGYKRFLLRNSGNDWYGPDYAGVSTMMKDAVFHRIVKGLDISVMAYRPAAAYINGEYWGIHNLRDSFDKHYLATHYGLDADNMDLLMHVEDELNEDKVKITRIDGDKNADEDYEALIDWIQSNPLSQSANYQQVQTWIDVTNHADYIIAESFFGNTDWPINNCDFWRAHTNQVATCGKYGDTRWRWMLYDLDVAGEKGADYDMLAYLSSSKMKGGSEPGFLINQLWSNMEFRNYFVTRYANLLNSTFRPERLADIIAQASSAIAPEIERHFLRWGRAYTQAQWQQAVSSTLVQYTATRHQVSFEHLNAFFELGGTGSLTVRNYDASGTGGTFRVNGLALSADTEGVTNRAAWSGTFFRSLPVPVEAVPDAGYVFDRWVGTTSTNPAASVFVGETPLTLTARFRRADAPLFTVTFDAQGGSVSPTSKVVAYDASYGELPDPARTGFLFGGWWTAPGGAGTQVTADSTVSTASNHTLYAKWTARSYTVTFDPQGGSVSPASKTVTYAAAYGALPSPARTGYAFGGWWTAPGGAGSQVTEASTVTTAADHTLYAKWTARTYTVTFDPQGGSVSPATKAVTFAAAYGALPVPSRAGFAFGGWWTAAGSAGSQVTEATTVSATADHTLYAKWTAGGYTVTFDPQGGSVTPATKAVTYAAAYGALPVPSRAGFAFDGWWTAPGGAGTQVNGGSIVTTAADHTLYAKWTAGGYTVTFDPQGGSVDPASKAVTFGAAYGALPVPSRAGYAFGGWWTAPGGAGTQVSEAATVTVSTDHTLYAKWSANSYTVTFDPQGGSVDPTNKVVTFDAPYGVLPEPSRTGYTFNGWQTATNGIVFGVASNSVVATAGDHTLAATWTTNSYSVTLDPQSGSVSPTTKIVTYAAAYGALPAPVRTGYIFGGWWTAPGGAGSQVTEASTVMTATDHTLYAKWTPGGYTVTFDPQGGSVTPATKSVTFAATYGALPAPSRTGYAFGGWWTATGGAGSQVTEATTVATAADHTLYAKWTANSFTVTFDPQGGSVAPSTQAVTFGATYGALPAPTRAGYSFGGWWTAAGGAGTQLTEASIVTTASDHTLYAKWAANSYSVTFNAQGGAVSPGGKTVTFGAAYGLLPTPLLPAPIRVDYMFGGWFTGANGTGQAVAADMTVTTAADQTLYAKWVPEDYLCGPEEDAPLATTGQYVGYFYQETPFADAVAPAVRGTFSLSLTKTNGTLTAKAVAQKSSLSFTAKAWSPVANVDGTKQVSVTIRSGETLTLYIRENRIWGSLAGGSLGAESWTLEGSRNRFVNRKDTAAQAMLETYKGYYTLALPLFDAVPTGAALATPEGSGFLTLTVGSNGKVSIAGRLADGTSFSQSSALVLFEGCGPEACVPLFAPLYSRKGWMAGLLWFTPGGKGAVVTDRDLGWFVRWEKPATFADGTAALLDAVGGYYGTVPALAEHYRLTAETNAVPYYYTGGAAALQTAALPDGIGVTNTGTRLVITRGTTPKLTGGAYDYSAENSAMATFSFTPKTGLFKGTFKLYYDYTLNERLQHKAVSASYAGVLTPVRAGAFAAEPAGQGYYLVPDNNPLWKTSRLKRSYRITLEAAR